MIPLVVAPVADLINTILKRVLPAEKMTEQERAQVELELLKQDWSGVLGQLEVNKQEAASESRFVAGWRPFVGWVCGAALAWAYVLCPLLTWCLLAVGVKTPPLPDLALGELMPVLFGLLGLGGLRTIEKVQGANKRR